MLTYILFAIGFIFLIKGADLLVDGSSSIAKRIGISDLVIGLTIVSFGTSAPELLVNIIASIKGAADIGVGNIVGSNIANILLIIGAASLVRPLKVKNNTTWKEIPLNFLAGVVLLILANDIFIDGAHVASISRSDGLMLMIFFCIFLYYTVGLARASKEKLNSYNLVKTPIAIIMVILGILGLTFGGKWVVDGASAIAASLGFSEALIGLTIVAVGTSLPELVTSVVAARKKNTDIAIGNVVGSNLFNIFWVLGLSAFIRPIPFNTIVNQDLLVYIIATVLLFIFCFTGGRAHVEKKEGIVFLLGYIAYIIFIVIRG